MANFHTNIAFPMGEITSLHNTCFITGKIIEIHKQSNSADVLTQRYERVNNVPFHYHCNGYELLEFSYTAFLPDDDVLLICRNARGTDLTPDMEIIGFSSGDLRPCLQSALFLVAGDYEKIMTVNYKIVNPDDPQILFVDDDTIEISDGGYGKIRKVIADPSQKTVVKLLGSFVHIDMESSGDKEIVANNGAVGTIVACTNLHYTDWYNVWEVFSGHYMVDSPETIYSAIEFPPISDVSCLYKGSLQSKNWSKTYDDVTVTAYEYGDDPSCRMWGIAATYKGKQALIDGSKNFGNYIVGMNRPDGTRINFYKGFDVWQEAGIYFIGCADDSGLISIFRQDDKTKNFVKEIMYIPKSKQAYIDDITKKYGAPVWDPVRLVGYYQRTVYFCPMGTDSIYWSETDTGEVKKTDMKTGEETFGSIADTLWNHATDELYCYYIPDSVDIPLSPEFEAVTTAAYNYYDDPWWCKVYRFGGVTTCGAGIGFNGEPKRVSFADGASGGTFTVLLYEGASNDITVTKITGGTSRNFGKVILGKENLNQGYLKNRNIDILYYHYLIGMAFNYALLGKMDCVSIGANETRLVRWMWDPMGGFAYETIRKDYASSDNGACILGEFHADKTVGDIELLKSASGFPHESWRAVIKHGIDRKQNEVYTAAAFDGFVKTGTGQKIYLDELNKNRVFWQTKEIKREK